MFLNENDLISSLLRSQPYVEEIIEELHPDDTLDLLKGTRKGKSEVKEMDHIVGVSNLQTRQKAKEQRNNFLNRLDQVRTCLKNRCECMIRNLSVLL